ACLDRSESQVLRAESVLQTHRVNKTRLAADAGNASEDRARLVRIGVDRWRGTSIINVVGASEPCDQVRMPAAEHPVNLGRGARRVLLHGCEQIDALYVCLLGEP